MLNCAVLVVGVLMIVAPLVGVSNTQRLGSYVFFCCDLFRSRDYMLVPQKGTALEPPGITGPLVLATPNRSLQQGRKVLQSSGHDEEQLSAGACCMPAISQGISLTPL